MQYSHAPVRKQLLQVFCMLFRTFQLGFCIFAVLDERTHDVSLPTETDLLINEGSNTLAHVFAHGVGLNRTSSGRDLVQHGHIQIAVHDECERARNRRSRHDKHMRRAAFRAQRGTLRHTEPMLLIRDNGTQPVELHTLLNERVRAHDHLRRTGLDGGQCCTFLRGSHRAGEQRARDAQLIQHGCKRLRVLRSEDFGRRHESRLPAVLRGQRTQSGRYHCLARADIALHQPVHRPSGGAVCRNLHNRTPLCAGRRKRQGFKERIQSIRGKNNAGIRLSTLLQLLQAAAEQKQLLEYHASARLRHIVLGFRSVNCRKCVYCVRQAVFRPQKFGQRIGPFTGQRVERGSGYTLKIALGQSRRQRIDRHDASRVVSVRCYLLRLRGNHCAAASIALHLAVEHILLSDAQLCRSIRIVEVGDVQRVGFIVNRTLDQRQALADTVDLGFGADHRAHGVLVLHVDFRNRRDVGAVLIVARVGLERVTQRAYM